MVRTRTESEYQQSEDVVASQASCTDVAGGQGQREPYQGYTARVAEADARNGITPVVRAQLVHRTWMQRSLEEQNSMPAGMLRLPVPRGVGT